MDWAAAGRRTRPGDGRGPGLPGMVRAGDGPRAGLLGPARPARPPSCSTSVTTGCWRYGRRHPRSGPTGGARGLRRRPGPARPRTRRCPACRPAAGVAWPTRRRLGGHERAAARLGPRLGGADGLSRGPTRRGAGAVVHRTTSRVGTVSARGRAGRRTRRRAPRAAASRRADPARAPVARRWTGSKNSAISWSSMPMTDTSSGHPQARPRAPRARPRPPSRRRPRTPRVGPGVGVQQQPHRGEPASRR